MSANHSPETIRFNAVDRYYLIPETDDPEGPYFPMLFGGCVQLSQPLERAQIIRALHQVNRRFPQFRLGYQLDYKADCWRKVTDLDAHIDAMVRDAAPIAPEEAMAEAVCTNITPLTRPMMAVTYGNQLRMHGHHSFADGKFGLKILAHTLLAACDPDAYDQLPDQPLRYGLPIWRIAWDNPRQGLTMLWNWIRTFKSAVEDYRGTGKIFGYTPEPIRNGSPMKVTSHLLPRTTMRALGQLRRSLSRETPITLNTLLQVMVAHRLMELGLLPLDQPVEYTQPIDLKRYKKDSFIYAGNLAGQVRVKTPDRPFPDLRADCIDFQTQLEAYLESGMPLSTLPSEWILALLGRRFYRKINRDWLTSSIQTDPRFFVLSSVGMVDSDFEPVLKYLTPNSRIVFSGSLMGAPPLLVLIAILRGEGHLCLTYNPRVLNAEHVQQIAEAFSPEWLQQHLDLVTA